MSIDNIKYKLKENKLSSEDIDTLLNYISDLELNFEKAKELNKMLKSDNNLLKKSLKEKEKNYLNTNFFKDKRIKELEQKIYDLEYKQVSIYEK